VHWTPGDGEYSLVTCRPVWQSRADPLDSQTFYPSTFYGSGSMIGDNNYVIYLGPDSSIKIIGLPEDSSFIVQVYTLNAPPFTYLRTNSPTDTFSTFTMHMQIDIHTMNACRNRNLVDLTVKNQAAFAISSYLWTFPDSIVTSNAVLRHHFNSSGYVTATVKALPDYGCHEQEVAKSTFIIPGVTFGSIKNQSAACTNESVLIKDSIEFDLVPRAGYTRKWTGPLGDTFLTSKIIQHFKTAGKYKVKEIVFAMLDNVYTGCSDTFSSIIQVYDPQVFTLRNDTCLSSTEPLKINGPEGMRQYNWNNTGNLPIYFARSPGKIKLVVTDKNGCKASDSIEIAPCDPLQYNATKSLDNENGVKVFPNPATGYLYIQTLFCTYKVEVFTAEGILIYESNNCRVLDVNNFNAGYYVMRLSTADKFICKKFIVAH
jgi:hypothetical protein